MQFRLNGTDQVYDYLATMQSNAGDLLILRMDNYGAVTIVTAIELNTQFTAVHTQEEEAAEAPRDQLTPATPAPTAAPLTPPPAPAQPPANAPTSAPDGAPAPAEGGAPALSPDAPAGGSTPA